MSKNKPPKKCTSEAQKKAIRRNYAIHASKNRGQQAEPSNVPNDQSQRSVPTTKKELPKKFPFWARLKISKHRTTLVIDEDTVRDKHKNIDVEGYVHREATHTEKSDYEEIKPNPDKDDPDPMYLKRPRKLPKRLFEPHNKNLDMPEHLRERYEKNNHKDEQ